jgi:argininosuccinate synthase
VERGLWFTPLREALQAFVNNVEERVTGSVRLRLFSGSCEVVNRTSAREPADSAPVSGALVHH